MNKKLRSYIVPTVVHCRFICEMEVEATSKKDAAERVRGGEGATLDGSYDWSQFHEDEFSVPSVSKIRRNDL